MPVYRSGCNALMMRFQAVQAGLKLSHHFMLPFHHPCCPAACAASPAAQAPAEFPTTVQSLPLTPLPLLGGYIMEEKIKFSSQTCSIFWALHNSEDLLVYLIVTGMIFWKVHVFWGFPQGNGCPRIAQQQKCSSKDWSGLAVGHKTWAGSDWGGFCSLKITWNDPSMLPCSDYPGPSGHLAPVTFKPLVSIL